MSENIPGFSGDASGGGGGGAPTSTSGNIAMALGFITEFNANGVRDTCNFRTFHENNSK